MSRRLSAILWYFLLTSSSTTSHPLDLALLPALRLLSASSISTSTCADDATYAHAYAAWYIAASASRKCAPDADAHDAEPACTKDATTRATVSDGEHTNALVDGAALSKWPRASIDAMLVDVEWYVPVISDGGHIHCSPCQRKFPGA